MEPIRLLKLDHYQILIIQIVVHSSSKEMQNDFVSSPACQSQGHMTYSLWSNMTCAMRK